MNKAVIRKVLLALAVTVALATLVIWTVLGAHTGWTQTSVPVTIVDEITGIEAQQWEDKFVPGLDFLGGGLLLAGVLGGCGLLFRKS